MQSLNIKENYLSYRLHKPHTHKAMWMEDMLKFNTCKKIETIYQMCTKQEMHIFNAWTIIVQRLNLKEWLLVEL